MRASTVGWFVADSSSPRWDTNLVSHVRASSPGSSRSRDASTAARLLALILSLSWGVLGFGLIDLETALPPGNPAFREHWFLESGWGLFITALVVVPLLVVALAPSHARDVAQQLHVMAGGAVAAGVLCLEPSMISLTAGFVITAWIVWSPLRGAAVAVDDGGRRASRRRWAVAVVAVYAGLPMLFGLQAYTGKVVLLLVGVVGTAGWLAFASRVGMPGTPRQARSWWLVVVSLFWFGPWLVYAVTTAHAYWEGLRYVGMVERVSAHVAFALTLAVIPLVAAVGWLPIRLPVSTACIAGGGFGAFAWLYPTHLLSPGSTWGVTAIFGCVAMLSAAEITLWRRGAQEYLARTPLLDPP